MRWGARGGSKHEGPRARFFAEARRQRRRQAVVTLNRSLRGDRVAWAPRWCQVSGPPPSAPADGSSRADFIFHSEERAARLSLRWRGGGRAGREGEVMAPFSIHSPTHPVFFAFSVLACFPPLSRAGQPSAAANSDSYLALKREKCLASALWVIEYRHLCCRFPPSMRSLPL